MSGWKVVLNWASTSRKLHLGAAGMAELPFKLCTISPGICVCEKNLWSLTMSLDVQDWLYRFLKEWVDQWASIATATFSVCFSDIHVQYLYSKVFVLYCRMSERDILSLSKGILVLSLCLIMLWGRLTLASSHHRSHSGQSWWSLFFHVCGIFGCSYGALMWCAWSWLCYSFDCSVPMDLREVAQLYLTRLLRNIEIMILRSMCTKHATISHKFFLVSASQSSFLKSKKHPIWLVQHSVKVGWREREKRHIGGRVREPNVNWMTGQNPI